MDTRALDVLEDRGHPRALAVAERVDVELDRAGEEAVDERRLVEHEDRRRFVIAVQWHPEDLVGHDAAARALFAAVVDAARARGRS